MAQIRIPFLLDSERQESEQVRKIKRQRDAPGCNDCVGRNWDDPSQPLSVHVIYCFEQRTGVKRKNGEKCEPLLMKGLNTMERRAADTRTDWQGEPMMGRLPYDRFGRLLVGTIAPPHCVFSLLHAR
jgi:hypothetical protein